MKARARHEGSRVFNTLFVNVEAVGAVADAVTIPVIASGGVASVDDIRHLQARLGTPIAGAVLGRALYAGTILPNEALLASVAGC